jgi:hypothetical protein
VVVEAALLLGAMVACGSSFGRVGLRFVDGHQDAWDPLGLADRGGGRQRAWAGAGTPP